MKRGRRAAAPPAAAPAPVVPLPDDGDETVRRRLRQAQQDAAGRTGYSRTLLSGQIGDASSVSRAKTLLGQ